MLQELGILSSVQENVCLISGEIKGVSYDWNQFVDDIEVGVRVCFC